MKKRDLLALAWDNLTKKKLRTFLTTAGVMIGVGALICMFAFGQGVQRNIKEQFNKLGLFNYIMASVKNTDPSPNDPNGLSRIRILNDKALKMISAIPGVEAAYPEMRFPAQVRIRNEQEFTLVQVLPVLALKSGMIPLETGRIYTPNEPNGLVMNRDMLRRMGLPTGDSMIGTPVEVRTLTLDFNPLHLIRSAFSASGGGLPISSRVYSFELVGISRQAGMGGPMPMRTDVIISPQAARGMKKLAITSLFDFFKADIPTDAYGSITVKVASPLKIDAVKQALRARGLNTFAWLDQMEEMKKGFLIMDMFLLAVGMIGTTVACLGIVNTMVMSVLERFREIGIMKAVGASDSDVHAIFLVESGLIGLLGGIMGLILAWLVGRLINVIVNVVGQSHGMSNINYFSFPLWLSLGGIGLAIVVSLIAGFVPTCRAASINPVAALRHD